MQQQSKGKNVLIILAVLLLCWAAQASATDWTAWRGPFGNGVTDETEWDPLLLQGRPQLLWEANVGVGYAAVAVKGERLYTIGNRADASGNGKGFDTVYCLDKRTGKELWRFSYPCETDDSYPGPTSTPVLDGDRLYTLSDDTGDLFCFNALDGTVRWHVNVVAAHSAEPPWQGFGYSSSPVIEGNLLLLNLSSAGLALDKLTGKKVWSSAPGPCSYSTPVVFNRQGKRTIALFGAKRLFLLDPTTGAEQASFPWDTFANENSADPLVFGDHIFISSAYDKGCALLKMAPEGLEPVWQSEVLSNLFTSSVYLDGFIYGIDDHRRRNTLRCIEAQTGKLRWSQKIDFGSLIAAAGKLIVLTERGELKIAEATPEAYREIVSANLVQASSARASGTKRKRAFWWTNPVMVDGVLYLRSDRGDLVGVSLRAGGASPKS
jgi:outer membrane protein assembly factor BamB